MSQGLASHARKLSYMVSLASFIGWVILALLIILVHFNVPEALIIILVAAFVVLEAVKTDILFSLVATISCALTSDPVSADAVLAAVAESYHACRGVREFDQKNNT